MRLWWGRLSTLIEPFLIYPWHGRREVRAPPILLLGTTWFLVALIRNTPLGLRWFPDMTRLRLTLGTMLVLEVRMTQLLLASR